MNYIVAKLPSEERSPQLPRIKQLPTTAGKKERENSVVNDLLAYNTHNTTSQSTNFCPSVLPQG
jgi:hypothetical protein